MKGKRIIRVGRGISLFVEVLGRVLREQMRLRIVEHQHWEFMVDNPVTTEYFGMNEPSPETPPSAWRDFDEQWGNKVTHTFAIGAAKVIEPVFPNPPAHSYEVWEPIEIRAHLKYVRPNRNDGDCLLISIWVRHADGRVETATFSYDNYGGAIDEYNSDQTPPQPPDAIAFKVAQAA